MERYSTSADERDTICRFFVFQEMGELPLSTNQPVSDRLVDGQLAQSKSHHADSCISQSARRRMPCPGLPFK